MGARFQLPPVAQDQLRESFQALAADALRSNTDEFLKLADQKIGNVHKEAAADLGKRQQALDALVAPIKDTLTQVDAKLREVDKARVDDSASMRTLLRLVGQTQQQLQPETGNLVRALRSPGVRGHWGEVQLRKVVELAGMMEHCDFDEQPTIFTERAACGPTSSSTCRAAARSSSTPRRRSKRFSTRRPPPTRMCAPRSCAITCAR